MSSVNRLFAECAHELAIHVLKNFLKRTKKKAHVHSMLGDIAEAIKVLEADRDVKTRRAGLRLV